MYLDSVLVCCLCKYVTFPFPFLSNVVVIDCGSKAPLMVVLHTSFAFAALSAAVTTSSPQHLFACFRILPVNFASPLSRNLRTPRNLYLHVFAMHWNVWQQRPSTYSMIGVGLKKAYTGAVQSFERW